MGKLVVIKGTDYSSVALEQVQIVEDIIVISTRVSPQGGGTVTGGGSYHEGDTVTLVATPNLFYEFVSWNDGNTNATRTIIVGDTHTIYTATFRDTSQDPINGDVSDFTESDIYILAKNKWQGPSVNMRTTPFIAAQAGRKVTLRNVTGAATIWSIVAMSSPDTALAAVGGVTIPNELTAETEYTIPEGATGVRLTRKDVDLNVTFTIAPLS